MIQPDLGNKISQARKERNMTQEELVDICNVSVRTIQRIESGEVTPRMSTVKIILAALDMDLNSVQRGSTESGKDRSFLSRCLVLHQDKHNLFENYFDIMQIAWIAGIVYFALGIVEAGMDYANFHGELDARGKLMYSAAKCGILMAYFLFFRGFVVLGVVFDNTLLRSSAYLSIVFTSLMTFVDIYLAYFVQIEEYTIIIYATESVFVGAIGIMVGLGLMKLQDGMGDLARFAGILEVIVGCMFVTVILFVVGYIVSIPMIILEIVLLLKGYEFIEKSRNTGA